jgi:nucleoside-diphosphate-sugar epimerase
MKVFTGGLVILFGFGPELLKNGYEVVVVDNFMYNQATLLDCCYDERLTIIRGDAKDKKLISDCLKKVDVILPLACLTGAPLCSKDEHNAKATNFDAIKMIINLEAKFSLKN